MAKITFMGAGSTVFARNVLGDCMLTDALCDSEISLYDIDSDRLNESYLMLSNINKNCNQERAKIQKYLGVENRKEALKDADFVVNAIQVGGYDPCTITDFEIPKKIRLAPDHCGYLGNRWYFPDAPDHSGNGGLREGHGGSSAKRLVFELH